MKSFILIIISLFFFSCHTKKLVQQSNLKQEITQQNAIVDSKSTQADAVKVIIDKTNDSTETVITSITYDTDKPVNSTGKPPIKQEMIITKRKTGTRKIETASGISISQEMIHKDSSKTDINTSQQIKIKENPKPPAVKYYLYLLLISVALVGGFCIYRYWSKIKTFLTSQLNSWLRF